VKADTGATSSQSSNNTLGASSKNEVVRCLRFIKLVIPFSVSAGRIIAMQEPSPNTLSSPYGWHNSFFPSRCGNNVATTNHIACWGIKNLTLLQIMQHRMQSMGCEFQRWVVMLKRPCMCCSGVIIKQNVSMSLCLTQQSDVRTPASHILVLSCLYRSVLLICGLRTTQKKPQSHRNCWFPLKKIMVDLVTVLVT
jgi:hypothetical protein